MQQLFHDYSLQTICKACLLGDKAHLFDLLVAKTSLFMVIHKRKTYFEPTLADIMIMKMYT